MRTRSDASLIRLLPLVVLLVAAYGCPPPEGQDLSQRLLEASEAAGVDVRAEEVFSISRGEESLAAAPVAGWESIPATQLTEGVDVAFAWIDTAEPDVPAGFYTLRAIADATSVGTVDARVQLVDEEGEVASEMPAVAEIHSLTVPEPPPFSTTFIVAQPDRRGRFFIWLRCPNGVCIRLPIFRALPTPTPGPDGPTGPAGDAPAVTRDALVRASADADVAIVAEETLSLFGAEGGLVAAPAADWARIPATELPNGVDFGFAYFEGPDVEAGYYTLRAFAEPTGVGTVPARVQLVGRDGETAGTLEATAEIHSMQVPENPPFERSVIVLRQDGPRSTVWFRCPNGVCIRFPPPRVRTLDVDF